MFENLRLLSSADRKRGIQARRTKHLGTGKKYVEITVPPSRNTETQRRGNEIAAKRTKNQRPPTR